MGAWRKQSWPGVGGGDGLLREVMDVHQLRPTGGEGASQAMHKERSL